MTTTTRSAPRTLALQGSPERARFWIFVLALGVPAVVIVATFGIEFAAKAPPPPVLVAPALALAISAAATLWILRALRRTGVVLDGDALVVDGGVTSRRFPLSSLRAGGVRIVNLAERTELRPGLRTWGMGLPGLASGWFRLRNGDKAFCLLTGRDRVAVLRGDDGTWVLLSLADPRPLRDAVERS